MPSNKPRFSVLMDKELLDKIEEYWHTHRLKNKNAAINELLRIALSDQGAVASDEAHYLTAYRAAPPLARKMVSAALDAAVLPDDGIHESRAQSPPASTLESIANGADIAEETSG